MTGQLVAAIAVIVLAVIYGKLVEHMRKRGIPIPGEDDEDPPGRFTALRPHVCLRAGESWMPVARTRDMKVAEGRPVEVVMTDPSGQQVLTSVPAEQHLVVCDGVFCSACGQRLVCRACGTTPTESVILESGDEESAMLACCRSPFFVESDVPDDMTSSWQIRNDRHVGKA